MSPPSKIQLTMFDRALALPDSERAISLPAVFRDNDLMFSVFLSPVISVSKNMLWFVPLSLGTNNAMSLVPIDEWSLLMSNDLISLSLYSIAISTPMSLLGVCRENPLILAELLPASAMNARLLTARPLFRSTKASFFIRSDRLSPVRLYSIMCPLIRSTYMWLRSSVLCLRALSFLS